jgi:nucleotide-binding universal stress UspA family protein
MAHQIAAGEVMASYLVVMDGTEESRVALRYAARRAASAESVVTILALIPPQEFVQWSGVQAAMEEEAKLRAEAMVVEASGTMFEEAGIRPSILVREGEPVKVVTDVLKEQGDISALILAAAAEGGPGPLISHFAGSAAGTLPCPVVIVPEQISEAALAS